MIFNNALSELHQKSQVLRLDMQEFESVQIISFLIHDLRFTNGRGLQSFLKLMNAPFKVIRVGSKKYIKLMNPNNNIRGSEVHAFEYIAQLKTPLMQWYGSDVSNQKNKIK